LEMTVAPDGGTGAPPLLPEPGVVLTEVDDPEPINCVVVVLVDGGLAFETEQPVKEKIPMDSIPMALNPFRFKCIMDLSVGGGSDCQVKVGEHLLWMYTAGLVSGLKNSP